MVNDISDINSESILYLDKASLEAAKDFLRQNSYEVFELDGKTPIQNKEQLMNAFYYNAKFPEYLKPIGTL